MLDKKGFDLWAGDYEKTVNLIEETNDYPFAGYTTTLNEIYNIAHMGENKIILDIGFGTGVLTKKLYDDGYTIFGIDFSGKMIEIAKEKMPNANLVQHDFSTGLPQEFANEKFDLIISTYAMHHLDTDCKVKFIRQLLEHLNPDGKVVIGDVAFETRSMLESCKNASGSRWDDAEFYTVYEDLKEFFPNSAFNKISHCAGVICFTK